MSEPEQRTTAAAGGRASRLQRFMEAMAAAANVFTVVLFLLLLATVFGMVIVRDVFQMGMSWMDDLSRYLQIWIVYTAAIALTMRADHIIMDAFYRRLPPLGRLWIRRIVGLVSLCFSALVGYLGWGQAMSVLRLREVSSSGTIPAIIGYLSLPVGFGMITLASLYYLLYWSDKDSFGSSGVS